MAARKVPRYRRREKKKRCDSLTSNRSNAWSLKFFFNEFAGRLSRSKKPAFFVARTAGIFAESPEMTVEGAAGPTSGWVAPFKKFSKK
jgi:hypothetical protein